MAEVISWPVSFQVGVTTENRLRGGAALVIAPGSLVCTPGPITARADGARAVTHQGDRADIYTARLVPPWFSVSIPILGVQDGLVASTWLPARARLRRTLMAPGFEVVDHITWTDRGHAQFGARPD